MPVTTRGSKERVICVLLFVLAALARVLFLACTKDSQLPFSIFYYGDSRLYREFALALIRGDLFDNGIPYHPPLFAYLLAFVISLVGENPLAMRAVLAIVSALVAPLTYLLGKRIWSSAVGLVGASFATVSFGLCVASVSPNTETVYIPLLVGQALCVVSLGDALRASDRRRSAALAVLCGVLVGAGSLTRAEHLAFLAICPLALALDRFGLVWREWLGEITPGFGTSRARGSSKGRDGGEGEVGDATRAIPARATSRGDENTAPPRLFLRACVYLVGAALVVIAPWTLHNYGALSRFNAAHPDASEPLPVFVAVSNYGALNFALANGPGADGSFRPDLIVGGTGGSQLDLNDPRQRAIYLHGYRQGLADLIADPGRSVRLIAKKLAIGLESFTLGFGASNFPMGLSGTRRAVDIFTPDRSVFMFVPAVFLVLGAWVSRRLWRKASIVWLAILHKVAICAAFFGYVRLFVQIAPFLYLIGAAGIVAIFERLPSGRAKRVVAMAGLVLATLLVSELAWRAGHPRQFEISGSSDASNGKIIQDAPLHLTPKPD